MKVGDKFKRTYPFKLVDRPTYDTFGMVDGVEELWRGGCHCKHSLDCDSILVADDMGFIEFEILAYVEMPRKYQNRVIYCVTMIDPDGGISHKNRAHSVTEKKFKSWVNKDCAYVWDFEMSDGTPIENPEYADLPF